MSETPRRPDRLRASDPRAGDRAVAILRELESHRTAAPEVPSLLTRGIARLLDLVLVLGAAWMVAVCVAAFRVIRNPEKEWREMIAGVSPEASRDPQEVIFAAVVLLLLLTLYEVLATVLRGQTAGKQLMSLRIMRSDSTEGPSARAMLLRTSLWAVPFTLTAAVTLTPQASWSIVVLLAGLVAAMLRDRDHRAPHDRLARTRVMMPR